MGEQPRSSRAAAVLVAAAVGGSAVAVIGWHLLSNRGGGLALDTSGFDLSSAPDSPRAAGPAAAVQAPRPEPSSLGMVKGEAGIRVVGPGGSAPPQSLSSAPKEAAGISLKDAMIKHQRFAEAFGRRMEAKHPSIVQYGRDWAASAELRALRDQYWRDRDPMRFAYGVAKSKDFPKLLKKYAADPGMRALIMEGVRAAPSDLLAAAGQVFQNDRVAKDLVTAVIRGMGLPPSLTSFLGGDSAKPPDQNQVMSEIMQSPDVQKAMRSQQTPVGLPGQR